ncbi:MAG TPA: hypothetical protein VFU21_27225 [Kofleriaceae bacterium]|nr:hypothetical protein [Kofleriaceae bacterium]
MDRPYFRNDLVARPLDDGGQRFIEVTDPDSGTSFKFYEIEYAIACAMDGERDVSELAEWAKIELGLDPSPDELQVVIGTLGDLGYLEGVGVARAAQPAAREEVIPQSAKPTPRMPLSRPPVAAGGAVTRGWDVQSGDDIDLGAPGKAAASSAPGGVTRGWDVPSTDEVELGMAGRGEQPARRGNEPRAAAGELELGAAGNRGMTDPEAVTYSGAPVVEQDESIHDRDTVQRSAVGSDFDDLSTDLSDHVPLAASELKEAVRSSKVMGAVKPPHEEDTQLEGPKVGVGQRTVMGWQAPAAPAAGAAAKPHVTVQKQPTAGQPQGGQPGAPARVSPPQQATPMVLPEKRAEISRPHPAATPIAVGEPHPGTGQPEKKSVLLPVLLVLVLLAAVGGVAYWYFVVRPETDGSAGKATPAGAAGTPAAGEATPAAGEGEPPAEPPAISAMLEAGPNAEHVLNAPRNGRFSWVATAGSEVAVGAPVAKYEGIATWERLLTQAQESQKKYQERLDQATSKGDKNAMKAAEDNVKRKQADIDRANTEMAKYVIAAPLGGVVEPSVEPRVWIKKDTPVAKILAQSGPRATFNLPAGRTHAAGDQVQVSSKADPTLKATCKVESADGQKLVVTCPTDSGLAAGSEVVLE